MAFLYVTEYSVQPLDMNMKPVSTGIGLEPAAAAYRVGNAGASTQAGAPFKPETRFLLLHADSICSFAIGQNPTAVVTANRMAAGETRLVGVNAAANAQSGTLMIAAVLNT